MFIELLLTESPRRILKIREPELFRLVERNFDEISEALEKGYSWYQIHRAFMKYHNAELKSGWTAGSIERYYKKIRKEKQS